MSDKGTAAAQAAAADDVAVADDANSLVADDTSVVAADEAKDDTDQDEDAATDEPEAADGEDDAGTDEAEQGKEALSKAQKKRDAKRRKVEARIQAVSEENQRLKDRLEAIERQKPPQIELGPEPDPAKFDSDAKYIAALAVYEARKSNRADQVKTYEADSVAARAATEASALKLFRERTTALKDRIPDIEEKVLADSTGLFDRRMADLIVDSEMGPEVAYYLTGHREEAQRIKSMSQTAAAREIGKIEAKLSLPKPRTETNAPPPPKILKGSTSGPAKKLEDMSMAEYRKARGYD
jgi:hypothetical protein